MPLRVQQGVSIVSAGAISPPPPTDFETMHFELPEAAPAALITSSHKLAIERVEQEQSEWCWAACATMVLAGSFELDLDQCSIASFLLEKNCCGNPHSCNVGVNEEDIQSIYEHFGVDSTLVRDSVGFSVVRKQIETFERPVEMCVDWFAGGSHVILIYGFKIQDGVRWVRFHDSLYGSGQKRFSDMKNYRGQSEWSRSWFGFRSI